MLRELRWLRPRRLVELLRCDPFPKREKAPCKRSVRSPFCAVILAVILCGCSTRPIDASSPNLVLFVPGIHGDGPASARLLQSLHDAGNQDCLRVSNWGSSDFIFFIAISDKYWHQNSQRHLAEELMNWRKEHPESRIVLIAHSAGAGIVAGAIARLPEGDIVGPVIFLAPALSPHHDLKPVLRHATVLYVFYSHADWFMQGIGPTVFGNYDGYHGSGAGRFGFDLSKLSPTERLKVVQHAYDPAWKKWGVHGGHEDWLDPRFVAAVLKPIIEP